ncbi:MAG: hypothetical protein KDC35_06730 [Acidobacteria bacterium]|nr:hypothetical protein [Acidobacteriota bacterium]
MSVLSGWLVPGMPHPYLCPEKNRGWQKLRTAYETARQSIEALDADLLVIYSTYWPSIIGHQIQALPNPVWTHVDEEWHELGSIHYNLRMDPEFAESCREACVARGLHARTVAYHGFPIDTGSVVALKLLNPDNRLPAVILSSNVYSDRAETIVLGKACRDALAQSNRRAVAISVSALSNRLFIEPIDPAEDRIHSLKDDEWNRKYLEFLQLGRLEDVSQLSRQFHREARVHKVTNFKPFWWLAAFMGQNNCYRGEVHAYEPVHGTGAAIVELTPTSMAARDLEYDEDDPDAYAGDRNVLGSLNDAPGMDGDDES